VEGFSTLPAEAGRRGLALADSLLDPGGIVAIAAGDMLPGGAR
jgi:hypothetical protein